MSEEIIALALGTVLAVGALAYVLYPLFFHPSGPAANATAPSGDRGATDVEERVRAYRAARRECARCGLRPEPDALFCSTCGAAVAPPSA